MGAISLYDRLTWEMSGYRGAQVNWTTIRGVISRNAHTKFKLDPSLVKHDVSVSTVRLPGAHLHHYRRKRYLKHSSNV